MSQDHAELGRRVVQRRLRVALVVVGVVFVFGVYPLIHLWPSGFRWQPQQDEYEQMIAAVYAVLGVFLIRAARDPHGHLSLIWFTVWSSLVHAAVMAFHAVADAAERVHLVGDVPALLVVAAVLAVLTPRRSASSTPPSAPSAGR
ncbi:DUF6632 domain-containing protein [Pseudonocardia kunmingensis]|uniref:Uncharacterized protein n=1 Tax=Pseudonocardia kunmingensis TaxID=630975 RepID=A0A543DKM6_9PSEU|nr:DUF6632 domain-containing protein [Pseudonocardia kunmingensis]TQM09886.1 hypothetical protein FB558_5661 [Pseudonocardia kunmingensis]